MWKEEDERARLCESLFSSIMPHGIQLGGGDQWMYTPCGVANLLGHEKGPSWNGNILSPYMGPYRRWYERWKNLGRGSEDGMGRGDMKWTRSERSNIVSSIHQEGQYECIQCQVQSIIKISRPRTLGQASCEFPSYLWSLSYISLGISLIYCAPSSAGDRSSVLMVPTNAHTLHTHRVV